MTSPQFVASASKPNATRVEWIDVARGLGILLVVFGHTLRGLVRSSILPSTGWSAAVDTWIYAFHMPLFFCLSGLFAPRLAARSWGTILWDRMTGIVYPYFVWSVLQTVVQIGLSKFTNNPADLKDLARIPYEPNMQFWFLYALFLISLGYALLVKLRVPAWAMLALGLVILLGPDMGLMGFWSPIGDFKRNFVYYVLGATLAGFTHVVKLPRATAAGVALIGFGIMTALVMTRPPLGMLLPLLCALIGIVGSMALAMSLTRVPNLGFLRRWGEYSLQIYVAHTLSSAGFRIFLQRVFKVQDPVVHLIGGTLVGILIPLLLIEVCDRLGFRYLFSLRPSRPAARLAAAPSQQA
jgi:fucose 4-O-acetylase-like acetyltransferase